MVRLEQFQQIELKVALVTDARPHPNAEKLLVLTVDVGGSQKEIVAGIARHYTAQELINKRIVLINNLEPVTIRGVTSQGMLLAAQDAAGLSLLVPERPVEPGAVVR